MNTWNPFKMVEKRLSNELPELEKKYKKVVVSHNNNLQRRDIIIVVNDIYKIILNKYYPFKPPDLLVKNKNYLNLLAHQTPYIIKQLQKKKINCLCCKSIICSNNWNATKKLIDIIDEYKKNKTFILNLYKKRYVTEICYNHNIFCSELIEMIESYF